MRIDQVVVGGLFMVVCTLAVGATNPTQVQAGPVGIAQEAGLTLSDYKYSESEMSLKATKIGAEYSLTFLLRDGWFVRGTMRGATGDAEYRGTGKMNGVPDHYFENRWGVGKSFVFGPHTLSPDVGLGYRHLFNDLRGVTDTGAVGYRRESRYLTARAGVRYRFLMPNSDAMEASVEHDRLILGRQDTRLSDIEGHGPWTDVPDVVNYQYRGEGWRFSATYRKGDWAVGSYLHLWRIKDSDKEHIHVVKTTGTENWTVWEPTNNTREIGVKVSYRF
jgi:hypothetical protein